MRKQQILGLLLSIGTLLTFTITCLAINTGELSTANTTYTDMNIVFSNITKTGATSTAPGSADTVTVMGKSISPGYAMIRLTDLKYLGATVQQSGSSYLVTINGQVIVFTVGSTTYATSTLYTINDPASGSTSYTFAASGSTETGTGLQYIDGEPYVRLTAAAHQCGALLIAYNSSEAASYVYHFRVSGDATALTDNNIYLVGGSWLTGWTAKGTTQLAPHFKLNELWYDTGSGTYLNQLKISVASLQAEENTRYYHNNNSSMTVTSGFRTWAGNFSTEGADARSLHMRGRAIDAVASDRVSLYNNVYNEFKGTYSEPIASGSIIWKSRVYGTSASLSGAYELERMPQGTSYWLHLGVKPQYSDAM